MSWTFEEMLAYAARGTGNGQVSNTVVAGPDPVPLPSTEHRATRS